MLALGYAGLIPFVVPALLVVFDSGYSAIAISTAETYALAIICFLTGSWWGSAAEPGNRFAILLSNVYLVLAFLLVVLAPEWWPLAASVLLIGIFILERINLLFPLRAHFYRNMRAILTGISSASMLVIFLAR